MILTALTLLPAALAGEVTLQNDDFDEAGGTVSVSVELGEAECVASTFVPDVDHYPFELLYIDAIVLTSENYEVGIWEVDDDGAPLRKIDAEAAQFYGSTSEWNRVTVSQLKLDSAARFFDEGNFAVVLCTMEGLGWSSATVTVPDNYMDYPGRNYLQTDDLTGTWEWFALSDLGVPSNFGDWIIRAVIETEGGTSGDGGGDGGGDGADNTGGGGGGDDGTTGDPGALSLSSITPNSAVEGEAIDVVVLGSGFASGAEARIAGVPLTGQSISNSSTITGRVPTSLPAGVHDVEVVLDGESSLLAGGFSVTEVGADDKGSCGCAASSRGGGPLSALWALAIGGLVATRRRR